MRRRKPPANRRNEPKLTAAEARVIEEAGRLRSQSPVATPRPHAGRKSKRKVHHVWLP